jgi:hypothetical protein
MAKTVAAIQENRVADRSKNKILGEDRMDRSSS